MIRKKDTNLLEKGQRLIKRTREHTNTRTPLDLLQPYFRIVHLGSHRYSHRVSAVKFHKLTDGSTGEKFAAIRERVKKARRIQQERFKNKIHLFCNARMESKEIRQYCKIDAQGHDLLKMAITQLGLSARAYDRILKVSRTIANIEECEEIKPKVVSEAI